MINPTRAFERPRWVPEPLFPFASRSIEIDGQHIHYIDEGEGPVLLLLHGNPTWSFLYRDIIQRLRDRFRCIAPDYPGFGLSHPAAGYDFLPSSHARVIEAFIETLDLDDIIVMLQDWGGPIGLWYAGRHPENIAGLVIGNTWGWPIDGDPHFERFSKMMGSRIGRVLIRRLNAFVNVMIPMNVRRHRVPSKVMEAYRGPFPTPESREPTWIFPREIRESSAFLAEVETGLGRLASKPVLIVWGDRDIAFKDKELRRFEHIFQEHRTVILEGAGHYIQEDAPGEIADAINTWRKEYMT